MFAKGKAVVHLTTILHKEKDKERTSQLRLRMQVRQHVHGHVHMILRLLALRGDLQAPLGVEGLDLGVQLEWL